MEDITIDGRKIGDEVFFIAEISANHLQDKKIAIETIKKAKESGADAVKLQTYLPELITIQSDKEYFKINQGTIWDGCTLYDLYQSAYTKREWHPELFETAKAEDLICFSSPFDLEAVDFLEDLNCPAYKIASFEITDIPLIKKAAASLKPIIISTGIATLENIEEALLTCKEQGNLNVILLKCTSAYPASLSEMNLLAIPDMEKRFDCIVGLSDHTLSLAVPIGATALGAKVIEKHFILDRNLGGPDCQFSLEPEEFSQMVKETKNLEKALGKPTYTLSKQILKSKEHSRSLFAVEDISKGEMLTKYNIRSIRPGFGLHTRYYESLLGKTANKNIEKGTPLSWDLIT